MPQVKMQRRNAPTELKESWSFADITEVLALVIFCSKLSKIRSIEADFLALVFFSFSS